MEEMRLQKIISQAGIASRRKAEELIVAGKVIVNGKRATLGQKATFDDNITVDGQMVQKEELVYYIINKPRKVLCTLKDEYGRDKITDFIKDKRYIFPVGRLDYDTTGTLFVTNDGRLTNLLLHPSNEVNRVYRARLNESLTEKELKELNKPIFIDGVESNQEVKKVDNKSYLVILHQGMYHHVKKIFEYVDRDVLSLARIEYAGISHVGLSAGEYRLLKPKEIKWLKQLVKY